MSEQPEFLEHQPTFEQVNGSHRPAPGGRQGELMAWLSALGAGIGTLVLSWRLQEMSALGLGATLLIVLLAILVSYGNWIERNTKLVVRQEGIYYRSPLRRRSFSWEQIEQLDLLPHNRGWRVRVFGEQGAFHYQSQGTLNFGSFDQMAVGIAKGEQVAAYIRHRSGLDKVQARGDGWVCRRSESRPIKVGYTG